MNYYYLNEQREVQGPFTAEQMRRMMADGTINGNTLASEAGGANWRPLDSLHLEGDAAPETREYPEASSAVLGTCPYCGTMLVAEQVPPNCPHCGKPLHPGTESLWQNAVHAFQKYATFRGRATRREYWSFVLFSFLVHLATVIVLNMLVVLAATAGSAGALEALPDTVDTLFTIVFFLPTLAVTVRRLHDTGHTGWWAVAPYGSILLLIPLAVLAYTAHDAGMALGVSMIVIAMAILGIAIYIFIQTLMPSQHGPNKYGPSLLFPRG